MWVRCCYEAPFIAWCNCSEWSSTFCNCRVAKRKTAQQKRSVRATRRAEIHSEGRLNYCWRWL